MGTDTMHLGTHTLAKANKWMNTHTHTENQCSCKKTANVKPAEMNHANGSADRCVQYYDFKPFKD